MNPGPIVVFLIATAFVGWFLLHRWADTNGLRKGRFEPAMNRPGPFAFVSDYGLVEIDATGTSVHIRHLGLERVIALARIRAVRLGTHHEILQGVFETRFDGSKRDRIAWHTVNLHLDSGEVVPVFIAGQLQWHEMSAEAVTEQDARGKGAGARRFALRVHARIRAEFAPYLSPANLPP